MTYDQLATIRTEADAFLVAAHRGLEPQVPGCPDWTVGDLTYHLGVVHRNHARHVVRGVRTEPDFPDVPDPSDDELLGWFDDGVVALLTVLRETPRDLPAWNWASHTPQTAAFWSRRMALETAVHRWDAESAHGPTCGFDLAVAVDGVDEMMTVMGPSEPGPDIPTGVAVVRATDAGRTWAVRLAPGVFEVVDAAPGTPDAALEGTASALLLALWGRADEVTASGDQALVDYLLS
ncbi:MAG: hypothetical protein JWN77_2696 [Frankiales bacterium]|nr:hypothetical protein [Frankiales bacterium]